ncbi:MAG TPA: MerC domain-containing protein [Catalimonadaceae bacterium]|jgi:hypothetical protein|nr:MerC domain-containing protein [Catalimonadaceae bacterium]
MLQEAVVLSQTEQNQPVDFLDTKEIKGLRAVFSDYLGLSGSFLCIIHCVAPQLLFLGSMGISLGSFFSGTNWHLFFWATCLVAVWQSARITPFRIVKAGLWFSFVLFSSGIFLDIIWGVENLISYSGSVLLVVSHGYNLIASRKMSRGRICTSGNS